MPDEVFCTSVLCTQQKRLLMSESVSPERELSPGRFPLLSESNRIVVHQHQKWRDVPQPVMDRFS
jgi:hypothetical protein